MSQHLPLRAVSRTAHRKCRFPYSNQSCRFVTTGPARRKKEDRAEQSPSALKESLAQQNPRMLEDIGLLPGTFVRAWGSAPSPLPKDGVSLIEALSSRWTYEKKYLKARIQNLYEMLYYKWWLRRGGWRTKPKQVFWHGVVKILAKDRYIELYEHLASGKLDPIREKLSPSLLEHLQTRIDLRPAGQTQKWTLLTKEPKIRVVSNRMSLLPIAGSDDRDRPYAIRQVVLRIKGEQQLKIVHPDENSPESRTNPYNPGWVPSTAKRAPVWSPDGVYNAQTNASNIEAEEAEPTPTDESELETTIKKTTVEYMVMQMVMRQGNETDWTVLGFTNKTTMKRLREMEEMREREQAWAEQEAAQGGSV